MFWPPINSPLSADRVNGTSLTSSMIYRHCINSLDDKSNDENINDRNGSDIINHDKNESDDGNDKDDYDDYNNGNDNNNDNEFVHL